MGAKTSRREFLNRSGRFGFGLWVVGGPRSRAGAGAPNETLNIAIVGAGGRGANNLDAMLEENVVALCDIDEQRLGEATRKAPKAKTFVDFRKMLDEMHQGIDAVVVSTPDHTHAVVAAAALKLNKHVYCEKPLTHSIHEARTLTELAAKAKVATQMGNGGHSSENTRRIVEIVRSGAIGPVREVHAWTNRPIWPQAIERPASAPEAPKTVHWGLWLGPAPERPYHPAYHPFKWRGWWDFGTGALGDMGCHVIDPAFWALELKWPSRVEAESSGILKETAPAWSIVRYEFPERGEQPPVKLTWYDGGKLPPKALFDDFVPAQGSSGSVFVGDKGRLLASHGRGGYRLLPEADFKEFEPPEPSLPRSPGHHSEWIAACKDGSPTGTHFDYAGPLTETVLLGNVALRAERPITWDGSAMKASNGETIDDLYVRRDYREGWSL